MKKLKKYIKQGLINKKPLKPNKKIWGKPKNCRDIVIEREMIIS